MTVMSRSARKLAALATVFATGIVLPLAVGAAPAHAAPQLDVAKFHTGDFVRGEVATYRFQVTNRSVSDPTSGTLTLTDTLPEGLTVNFVSGHISWDCDPTATSVTCTNDTVVQPFQSYPILELSVQVAEDAPCTLSNSVTVSGAGSPAVTSTDLTTVSGGDCDNGGGGNGGNGGGLGSILPINLDGIIPFFNNITLNKNEDSPGASNTSHQEVNAS
ncbi:hypothetical protein [Streptomyces sp. NPDC007984]|uniref:hypothetical protein n=1 Tax=Streptomyces sp. NPDC007984 TaxID=3364801 RepID=UPI0036ECDD57